MKTMRLLAPKWKWLGAALAALGLILGFFSVFHEFEFPWLSFQLRDEERTDFFRSAEENFTNEIALTLTVVGLLILAYTREKIEDERVRLIRLEAFQWSVLISFLLVLAGNWLLYSTDFYVFMVFNLFTPLVVFVLRFHYVLYKEARQTSKDASL